MIQFSSYDPEPIPFEKVEIGQWFRCGRYVYMRTEAIGDGRCVVDTTGHLIDFNQNEPIDEILVGTYTITLT